MNAIPGEPPPDPQFWGSRTWTEFHVPPEYSPCGHSRKGARGPEVLQ